MSTSRRIPVVTVQQFATIMKQRPRALHENPWIVEGHVQGWAGYARWRDLNYLNRRFGHLRAFAKAPNFITNIRSKLVSVETTFEQYISYIQDPGRVEDIYRDSWMEGDYEQFVELDQPLYCGTLRLVHKADDPIFEDLRPLLPEPLRPWNDALPYYYSLFNHLWLLVSLPGALTPLHTDNNGTIATIAQLRGRKRATLYSPTDLVHVRNDEIGFMDPKLPNEADFPNWQKAVKWVGDLEVGQVLFVGTDWAHHVETLETSISVSFDFIDSTNLAAYSRSSGWATVLGDRVKRNPDLFIERTGGKVTRAFIEASSPLCLGRDLMRRILRSRSAEAGSEINLVRDLYAANLEDLSTAASQRVA